MIPHGRWSLAEGRPPGPSPGAFANSATPRVRAASWRRRFAAVAGSSGTSSFPNAGGWTGVPRGQQARDTAVCALHVQIAEKPRRARYGPGMARYGLHEVIPGQLAEALRSRGQAVRNVEFPERRAEAMSSAGNKRGNAPRRTKSGVSRNGTARWAAMPRKSALLAE